MKNHLNDGQLRAAQDGELDASRMSHLETCRQCQERLKLLESNSQRISGTLAFLSSNRGKSNLSASQAWHRFKKFTNSQKESNMIKKIYQSPVLRFGVPVVLALALILAIPETRALASELLNLFRVQQVAVVPIDFTGMEQLNGVVGNDISRLISDSITMTKKPGDPALASDADQAGSLAGFDVRLPLGTDPTTIYVTEGTSFTFTIDRKKVQALLEEAGRSDLVLPETIDGQEISVEIPASISAAFGTCPPPSTDGDGFDMNANGSPGRRYADCVILAEIPSPSVSAPVGVNVSELAQIGLEFSGMTSEEAAAFTSTVDWTSTLVVPIPKNAASYKQIEVDGVTGTLIQRPADDYPQFALLWVKDGIIYAIGGLGSNSQKAIHLANSLP